MSFNYDYLYIISYSEYNDYLYHKQYLTYYLSSLFDKYDLAMHLSFYLLKK